MLYKNREPITQISDLAQHLVKDGPGVYQLAFSIAQSEKINSLVLGLTVLNFRIGVAIERIASKSADQLSRLSAYSGSMPAARAASA